MVAYPSWEVFARVEIGAICGLPAPVAHISLEGITSQDKALLLGHELIVVEQIVLQLQVVLLSGDLLPGLAQMNTLSCMCTNECNLESEETDLRMDTC